MSVTDAKLANEDKLPVAHAHSKRFGHEVEQFTDVPPANSKLVDNNNSSKFLYSHTLKALVISLNCSQISLNS